MEWEIDSQCHIKVCRKPWKLKMLIALEFNLSCERTNCEMGGDIWSENDAMISFRLETRLFKFACTNLKMYIIHSDVKIQSCSLKTLGFFKC